MIPALIESAVVVEALRSSVKEDALRELLDALAAAGLVGKRDIAPIHRQLKEREALGSTGIGNGVAVPHVKVKQARELALALGRSSNGVEYQAIDGKPVHTLFLIVAPLDRPDEHLQALRWVSGLARSGDFRRFVLAARDAPQIRDLLREMSASR